MVSIAPLARPRISVCVRVCVVIVYSFHKNGQSDMFVPSKSSEWKNDCVPTVICILQRRFIMVRGAGQVFGVYME